MPDMVEGRFAQEILRWLQSLPNDLETLREALLDRKPPPAAKRLLIGAMGYRLRSIDLVPDPNLADDCCVLRVAADLFVRHKIEGLPLSTLQKMSRLANDVETVKAFLGARGYAALEEFCEKLASESFRGRSPEQVLADEVARGQFLREVSDSCRGYAPPADLDATRLEIDVRNYMLTKLGVHELR